MAGVPSAAGGAGIAPRVVGLIGLSLSRSASSAPMSAGWRCNGSPLPLGRPKASSRTGSGGWSGRRVLALVAPCRSATQERAVERRRVCRTPGGGRIDRRARDRARRHPLAVFGPVLLWSPVYHSLCGHLVAIWSPPSAGARRLRDLHPDYRRLRRRTDRVVSKLGLVAVARAEPAGCPAESGKACRAATWESR